MLRRHSTLFACLIAIAICVRESDDAICQEVTPDELITEFYGYYPDVFPNRAFDSAKKADPAAVLAALNGQRPESERFALYQIVVHARLPGYKQAIKRAIKDPAERIRSTAVYHLPLAYSKEQLLQQYSRLTCDKSLLVRYYVVEHLGKHPSKPAADELFKMLADASVEVRHEAAFTLTQWNDDEVIDRLRKLAQSDSATVAGVASCALARLPNEGVNLEAIHEYLRRELSQAHKPGYEGPGVVAGVARLLGEHGNASSIPVLREATKCNKGGIPRDALNAITTIEGRVNRTP